MDFNCKKCNKKYSSYQSFWNHNKKYHSDEIVKINDQNHNKCERCSKILSSIQSKWRHMKKCKVIQELEPKMKPIVIYSNKTFNKLSFENKYKKIIENDIKRFNKTLNDVDEIIKIEKRYERL